MPAAKGTIGHRCQRDITTLFSHGIHVDLQPYEKEQKKNTEVRQRRKDRIEWRLAEQRGCRGVVHADTDEKRSDDGKSSFLFITKIIIIHYHPVRL
jgi:hypothetical protein